MSSITSEPTREEVDNSTGPVLLEFGASWCPHCQAIQRPLATALQQRPEVRHVSIEDGKGRPLGRSYRVKLWPTLVYLHDGREIYRAVRPSRSELEQGFEELKCVASSNSKP